MKVEFRLGQLAKLECNFIAGIHVASLAGVKRKRGYPETATLRNGWSGRQSNYD